MLGLVKAAALAPSGREDSPSRARMLTRAQLHKRDPKLRRQAAGAVRRNLKAERDQEKPKPRWLELQKLKGASPWAVGTGGGSGGCCF